MWKTDPFKTSGSVAGGAWRTRDHGQNWTQIWSGDSANGIGASVTSITVNPDPQFPGEAWLCTRFGGLYFTSNVLATNVVWQQVTSYPFRAPTRVFYDPNRTERIWITSNGNGLRFAYRPGSFSEWQLQQFGAQAGDISIAGPNADPDGDGLTNMMEYALKTNPLVATSPGVVNTAPYGPYLSASLAKNPVAVDIVWSIESGTDPATWSSTGATTIQNDESIFWARSLLTIGSVPRLFLRLKCTLLP